MKIVLRYAVMIFVAVTSQLSSIQAQVTLLEPSSRKEPLDIEKPASKLFKQAEENYKKDNVWQAAVDLILILDFYPEYSRLEDVVFMLAGCFYELEMYDGADKMYRYLLRSVTKTRLVAESILGLQKVAYLKGDYQQSLKFYKAIESHYTEHDAIYEARYHAELTYYNMESYTLVQNMMPHMSKKSDFYPFAVYISAVTHLKKKMFVKQLSSS